MPTDKRLRDENPRIRLTALEELFVSRLPDPDRLSDVGSFLSDQDPAARRLAVEVFVMYGADGVRYLIESLDQSQPLWIRNAAATGLGRLGAVAIPAVPWLCSCLESNEEELRDRAGFALSRIGKAAVPSLRIMLKSSNPDAVMGSIGSLAAIGEDAIEIVDDLHSLASLSHLPILRMACLSAIGRITGQALPVVQEMLAALKGADEKTIVSGLEKITDLGGLAMAFGPDIAGFTDVDSPDVRAVAAMGLAKVQADPALAVPVLIRLLDDHVWEVRKQAIMALACFGPDAADAAFALNRLVNKDQQMQTGMVRAAMGQISRTRDGDK